MSKLREAADLVVNIAESLHPNCVVFGGEAGSGCSKCRAFMDLRAALDENPPAEDFDFIPPPKPTRTVEAKFGRRYKAECPPAEDENPPAAAGEGRHCEGCNHDCDYAPVLLMGKHSCPKCHETVRNGEHVSKCPGIPAAQPAVSEEDAKLIELAAAHAIYEDNRTALYTLAARLRGEGK